MTESLLEAALRDLKKDAEQAVRESSGAWVDYYAGKRDAYKESLRLAQEYSRVVVEGE